MTPMTGVMTCNTSGTTSSICPLLDPSGFASINASAASQDGFVSVALTGGAALYGAFASATSRATSSQEFLFSNGTGTGSLIYTVALRGFSNGNPSNPATVLFNGSSYSVLPNALPTYYSFTRNFVYGQAFVLALTLEMTSNWNGSTGDSGSRFASAELTSTTLLAGSALSVPEPTSSMMLLGGALLILVGLHRTHKQR